MEMFQSDRSALLTESMGRGRVPDSPVAVLATDWIGAAVVCDDPAAEGCGPPRAGLLSATDADDAVPVVEAKGRDALMDRLLLGPGADPVLLLFTGAESEGCV